MRAPPAAPDPARFASAGRDPRLKRSNWHWHVTRELQSAEERLLAGLGLPPGARVLDYGCGNLPHRDVLAAGVELVGADLPGNPVATVEIEPDGRLPVEAATFDAVISTQVLEHVGDPGLYLAESHRVLRPGGRIMLSTVGLQVYHPDPVDLWRWTCAGLQRAVSDAGFEVERFEGIMGLMATGLQFVQNSLIFRLESAAARRMICRVMQTLVALADRFERQESRDMNAMCFALVARR